MKGKYWPLVGLGFGACQVAGLFMDDQPPTDGPATDLAAFYAGRFHLELIAAGFLVAAAGIFLALFAGLVRERLGAREPGLVAVAYASGLLYAALLIVGAAVSSTISVARAVNDVPPPSPDVARYVVSAGYAMIVWVATLLGVVPFIGPLIYMLFRPPEYIEDVRERELEIKAMEKRLGGRDLHCPVCRAEIEEDFLICPVCTTKLRQSCVRCHKPLEALWQVCPYCETPIEHDPTTVLAEVKRPPRRQRSR